MKMIPAFSADDELVAARSVAASGRRRREKKEREEPISLDAKMVPSELLADDNTASGPHGAHSLIRSRVERLGIPAGYNDSLFQACKKAYDTQQPVPYNAGRSMGRQDVFGVVKGHYKCGNMARVLNCEIEVSADGNDYVIHPPALIVTSKAA